MARANITYVVTAEDKTRRALAVIGRRFEQVGRRAAVAFGGITTAGAAALTALTVSGLKSADALGKTSDKLGEIPSKIQGLQRAAALTGVSVETANMALQRMVRRVSEAAVGTGEAQGALRELNLDAKKLASLPLSEQFQAIAGAMEGTASQGDRVRLSMKLFDSEGVALVNTLALGEQGLKDIQQEIDDYGLALTRIDIAKIEAANDAFFRAKTVVAGFGQQFAAQVAPILEGIANRFLDVAKEAGGMGNVATQAMDNIVKGVGFASDAINGLKVVWLGVKTVAISALAGPLALLAELELSIVRILNWIPGVNLAVETTLGNLSSNLVQAAIDAGDQFRAALLAPPPSEQIRAFIDPIIAESQRAAEAAAAATADVLGGGGAGGSKEKNDAHVKEQERMRSLADAHFAQLFDIEKQWNVRTLALVGATGKQKAKLANKTLIDITKGAAQHSKALFKINKVAAIAQILIDTPAAVSSAFRYGNAVGGPPVGFAFAAVAAAAQLAQLNAAKSATFTGNGGGTTPSSAGGYATVNSQPISDEPVASQVQPSNIINIDFSGGITDTNAVREFIENDFAEALRDGSGLNVQVVAV